MSSLPDDPYVTLGVPKNAQIQQIRSEYKKLVLKCHPDKVTDPAQKAVKQEEFQRVQKAYELLSDEKERQKYDDLVVTYEFLKESNQEERRRRDRDRDRDQFTPGRTPPRHEPDYRSSPHYNVKVRGDAGFNVRTAEPPPSFSKSSSFPSSKSPYHTSTRTPPRSYEDDIHFSSGYDEVPRESRKAKKGSVVYEKEIPSRHEKEERRRRDDEWDRVHEKSKRKEQERKEHEKRETERKEKERRKEEKKRAEKVREQERKRDSDEKARSRHKSPYVEELDPETVIYTASPPKVDKKAKSSSSRKHEVPVREPSRTPVASERERKQHDNLEFAAQYLETSRSKAPPGLARAKTYHTTFNIRHVTPPPIAVPTPPPAAHNVAAPPPPPVYLDEEVRRSAARSSARRMSHDSPRVKVASSASHKKSSHVEPEPIRPPTLKKSSTMPTGHGTPPSVPESPPRMHRAQTGGEYSRPPPGMPSMARAHTWMPGDDDRDRSRSRHAREYADEDSEEEDRRPRRSRRARSPDDVPPIPQRYTVDKTTGRTLPIRSSTYHDDSTSSRKAKASYYMPEANVGRPMDHHRPSMPSHHSYGTAQYFDKVKTAKTFAPDEISFSDVPHTPVYRDPVYTY